MYGHAIAELVAAGHHGRRRHGAAGHDGLRVPAGTAAGRARAGAASCHPWESGCDDSPRWEAWAGPDRTTEAWRGRKGELVASIERSAAGSPVGNPGFEVESAAFNALVAFNALELADVAGADRLPFAIEPLRGALDARWDAGRATWTDGAAGEGGNEPQDPRGPPAGADVDPIRRHRRGLRPGARRPGLRRRVRPGAGPPGRAGLRPAHLLAGARPGRSSPTCCGWRPGATSAGTMPRGWPMRSPSAPTGRAWPSTGIPTPVKAWVPSRSRGRRWPWSRQPTARPAVGDRSVGPGSASGVRIRRRGPGTRPSGDRPVRVPAG